MHRSREFSGGRSRARRTMHRAGELRRVPMSQLVTSVSRWHLRSQAVAPLVLLTACDRMAGPFSF
ncbi:hypothetical protein SAMN04487926_102190 [Paraburkholderia steynii]|uniref:Uncharacterized protein n=1 Tax=Paraburkholderia steynii TaxID=1245441 RepID=A0A7Z7FEV9_9BURK|nr:hypothetical protein SAMN04487926_102190 [Paraburkholderia steynii]